LAIARSGIEGKAALQKPKKSRVCGVAEVEELEVVLPEPEVEQPVVGRQQVAARAHASPGRNDLEVLHLRQRLDLQLGHLLDEFPDLDQPVVVEPVPVAEVEASPLHEQRDPPLDLFRRCRHGTEVDVAVEDAVVDTEGRRDHVVPGVVLRQGRDRELKEGGVPRGQRLGPVNAVLKPEAALLVVPTVLGEQRRVRVELLPALRPGRRLDLERAGETVGHRMISFVGRAADDGTCGSSAVLRTGS